MKPLIDQAFWSDPDIEGAKAGVKLAALWLITNSQTSLLGLCAATMSRFTFETALPEAALKSTLETLPRSFTKIGGVIFVRNYVRHQFGCGEKLKRNNFFVALKSAFLAIKDAELRAAVLLEYPEFEEGLTKPSEGLTKPKDVQVGRERAGRGKGGAGGKPEKPESLEAAIAYGREIGMSQADVEAWHDHFESNGWRVSGKTPMKDWKAALRNGNRRKDNFRNGAKRTPTAPTHDPTDTEL